MGKVIAICGKICSGKSYYANLIKEKENAVILSCDEITSSLFDNNLGEKHDEMSNKIKNYLLKKSIDILQTGTNVILDWGFWTKAEREYIRNYFNLKNVEYECHYIDIDDERWKTYIAKRNEKVLKSPQAGDYYLDEGLLAKLLNLWEKPTKEEIDVWVKQEK